MVFLIFVFDIAIFEGFRESKYQIIQSNLTDTKAGKLSSVDSDDCFLYINSDQDLVDLSFPGLGTEINPYRIENLSIFTIKDYGIYLENTSKSILIQNCYISAHYQAISIYNTTEKTITIKNNTLYSDNYFGIFIIKSSYIKVLRNTISNCYHAIEFNESPHTVIANNSLIDNICGIRVEYSSSYSQIISNNFTNNYEGLWLANSGGHFLIQDNLIISNTIGILLADAPGPYFPDYCIIKHNLIESNTWYGMVIESDYNVIFHNTFVNNNLEGICQAKDSGLHNIWCNTSLKEGNYWSNWWGFGSYLIDGSVKSNDPYPTEIPFHSTNSPIPTIFIGRLVVGLFLGLGYVGFVIISFLMIKKITRKSV